MIYEGREYIKKISMNGLVLMTRKISNGWFEALIIREKDQRAVISRIFGGPCRSPARIKPLVSLVGTFLNNHGKAITLFNDEGQDTQKYKAAVKEFLLLKDIFQNYDETNVA